MDQIYSEFPLRAGVEAKDNNQAVGVSSRPYFRLVARITPYR